MTITTRLRSGAPVTIELPEDYTWEDIEYLVIYLRSLVTVQGGEDIDD